MRIALKITRPVLDHATGEEVSTDIDVVVLVDEGVPGMYGYDDSDDYRWPLTDDERDRARDAWERLEQ